MKKFLCAEKNRALGYFLFETMLLEKGHLLREKQHRKRLMRSIQEMRWPWCIEQEDPELWWGSFVANLALQKGGRQRVRLEVTPSGSQLVTTTVFSEPPIYPDTIQLCLDPNFMRFSKDPFNRWKTGSWGRNLHALYSCIPPIDDVIFTNENGEICETSKCNIYMLDNEIMYTPPVSCGLLPGTVRQEILDRGFVDAGGSVVPIQERIILSSALNTNSSLWVSNALTGFRKAKLASHDSVCSTQLRHNLFLGNKMAGSDL